MEGKRSGFLSALVLLSVTVLAGGCRGAAQGPTGGGDGSATPELGSGGRVGAGGATGADASPARGGATGTGGGQVLGGASGAAGALGTGGTVATGGTSGAGGQGGGGVTAPPGSDGGGRVGTGGASTGGMLSTGGTAGTGGTATTGGVSGRGGAGSGGVVSAGGTTGNGPVTLIDAASVRLLPGSPFYDRQELHRKGYLAQIDTDKLLFPYRSLAKLPQPSGVTGGYAGWDTGFLQGHFVGHYLSAASRMSAATGDATFAGKVTYLVAELGKCQTALGKNGYLAAFPTTVFDWLEGTSTNNGGIVVPYYIVHKLMAGLLDAHHYLGNQQALDVATRLGDYFQARLAGLSAATLEKIFRTDGSKNPQNEFGAMGDALAQLSVVTGQAKYLDTAKLFNRPWFMTPLVSGQDNLQGLHANTHIGAALGIAHLANLTADPTSLQSSESFWKLLTGKHAFVNGGNSFREWLDKPGVEAGPSIDGAAVLPATTAETCNSHNMLKLTAWLFQRGPRMDYADYHERTLYNHVLATIAPDTGQMTYFTPMYGHFRTYIDGTYCCTGTGIENTPRYNEGIYFQQGSSLWVNLYVPSELTWAAAGMTIRQEGHAAAGETVRITIAKAATATPATIHLRVPSWVAGAPTVEVNGTAQGQSLAASTYLALTRTWNTGDVVSLTLPSSLRLERAKDVSSMVAVFLGPLLLAGELGSANMPNDFADKDAYLATAAVTVPTLANASANPADWLDPVAGSPLAFKVRDAGSANGIVFRPLYQVHHQRYAVYWPQAAK